MSAGNQICLGDVNRGAQFAIDTTPSTIVITYYDPSLPRISPSNLNQAVTRQEIDRNLKKFYLKFFPQLADTGGQWRVGGELIFIAVTNMMDLSGGTCH